MTINKLMHLSKTQLKSYVQHANGLKKSDLVIKNGKFLDIFTGRFIQGDVAIHKGLIVGVMDSYEGKETVDAKGAYIVPGFIDAHVHIESSLLTPSQYQQIVLPKGTTTVVWDPHEISNTLGIRGLRWALEASKNLLLDIFVMISSCVPATNPQLGLETSGATLYAKDISRFVNHACTLGLGEMMNFPGVFSCEDDVLEKLVDFQHKNLEGHSPLVTGKNLNAYAVTGIKTCHESTTMKEAREKLAKGIHILIREGSCAKDANSLLPLLNDYTSSVIAFCTDDRNCEDIATHGHIDNIINMALQAGHKPENVFRAASFAITQIYDGLKKRGVIAPGYLADVVLVNPVQEQWKKGIKIQAVYKNGIHINEKSMATQAKHIAKFTGKNLKLKPIAIQDLAIPAKQQQQQPVHVIGIAENSLLTQKLQATLPVVKNVVYADIKQDVLKIAVFERHHYTGTHGVGFVKGFQIKHGAIATSINHDSHNVIVVGSDDELIKKAVNRLIKADGGIVVINGKTKKETVLPLSVGGLMSNEPPKKVRETLRQLKKMAKQIGCPLQEPFIQLSFLALVVIPSLKITDQGLVDADAFKKIDVCL